MTVSDSKSQLRSKTSSKFGDRSRGGNPRDLKGKIKLFSQNFKDMNMILATINEQISNLFIKLDENEPRFGALNANISSLQSSFKTCTLGIDTLKLDFSDLHLK